MTVTSISGVNAIRTGTFRESRPRLSAPCSRLMTVCVLPDPVVIQTTGVSVRTSDLGEAEARRRDKFFPRSEAAIANVPEPAVGSATEYGGLVTIISARSAGFMVL